jgi:hypothetical protein
MVKNAPPPKQVEVHSENDAQLCTGEAQTFAQDLNSKGGLGNRTPTARELFCEATTWRMKGAAWPPN